MGDRVNNLKGTAEFKARLKAAGQMFKPYGREWTDEYVRVARPMVAVRTGKTRMSIRRRNASQRKATVQALFTAIFIDQGTKRHTIVPKRAKALYFTDGGSPRFVPQVQHPGSRARPFREEAMRRSIRNKPMADRLIREWNGAA
jgi:hypothetical protein